MGQQSRNTQCVYVEGVKILTNFLQKIHSDETISIITKVDPYDLLDTYTRWLVNEGYRNHSFLLKVDVAEIWLRYHGVKIYKEGYSGPRRSADARAGRG